MKIEVKQACKFLKPELAFELKNQKPQVYEDVKDELADNKFFKKLVKAGKIKVLEAPEKKTKKGQDKKDE